MIDVAVTNVLEMQFVGKSAVSLPFIYLAQKFELIRRMQEPYAPDYEMCLIFAAFVFVNANCRRIDLLFARLIEFFLFQNTASLLYIRRCLEEVILILNFGSRPG